ncbi:MAG: pyridoxamine 5'-phosphate oxidase family protein [Dermatophilaceae bacterium]
MSGLETRLGRDGGDADLPADQVGAVARGPAGPAPVVERLTRYTDRGVPDRAALDAVLDEAMHGTLATVVDGRPLVVPMFFARDRDRVLVHGSTGAGALRRVAAGAPAAFAVTILDGLVVAHSTFESSANYRSAVLYGELLTLSDAEQARALEVLSDRLIPGRVAEVGESTRKELAATLAMALPITDGRWLLKTRSGGPTPPDAPTDAWCGVVPLRTVAGEPEPAGWSVDAGIEVPDSVRALVARSGR